MLNTPTECSIGLPLTSTHCMFSCQYFTNFYLATFTGTRPRLDSWGGCSSVLVIHLYPWVYLSSEDVLWLIHLVTDLDVVLGKRYSIASPILCFIAVSVQSVTWVQTYHNHLPNCKGSSNDNCRDRAGSGHTL